MANVPLTPDDRHSGTAAPRRRLILRVIAWALVSVAMAAVFLSYQQVDLAVAWITAKLCN